MTFLEHQKPAPGSELALNLVVHVIIPNYTPRHGQKNDPLEMTFSLYSIVLFRYL